MLLTDWSSSLTCESSGKEEQVSLLMLLRLRASWKRQQLESSLQVESQNEGAKEREREDGETEGLPSLKLAATHNYTHSQAQEARRESLTGKVGRGKLVSATLF